MNQINNQQKVIIVTRQDLNPGYQLTQAAHASINLIFQYYEKLKTWQLQSNSLVCLSVKDEKSLLDLIIKLDLEKIEYVSFQEPDISNQTTAIAIIPNDKARKITSSIPLALKGIGTGLNKHTYQNEQI